MNVLAEYRRRAAECERLAGDAITEAHRQAILKIAESWHRWPINASAWVWPRIKLTRADLVGSLPHKSGRPSPITRLPAQCCATWVATSGSAR